MSGKANPASKIVINGRFLSRPPTGVDRVAGRLVVELDRLIAQHAFDGEVILAAPRRAACRLPLDVIRTDLFGDMPGLLWEQIELPARYRRELIFNPCNTAPILHPRNVVLIHDALVYDAPRSYTAAFRWWYKALLPIIAKRAVAVATVSRHSAERLEARKVARPGLIEVIHNGADHLSAPVPMRAPHGEKPFAVFVGSHAWHKNLPLFCAIAMRFAERMDFLVVGARDDGVFGRGKLAPPPPNVKLLGRVADNELAALYQNAICLVFPSLEEGFGLPPLEAMVLGCPVIATNCSAMPEVLGEGAMLLDPTAPDQWAAAIERLAGEPAFRARMIEAGRTQAQKYRWDSAGLRYAALLQLHAWQRAPTRQGLAA